MAKRGNFGNIRHLKSGNYQARYTGPDGQRHKAGKTFPLKGDAQSWLDSEEALIRFNQWTPPADREKAKEAEEKAQALTVGVWMPRWLDMKAGEGLKPSTLMKYRERVGYRIAGEDLPADVAALAGIPVTELTTADVREWWKAVQDQWPDTGEQNRKAYEHLKSAFDELVDEEVIEANPVVIRAKKRTVKPKYEKNLPTDEELAAIYATASDRYRVITMLTQFEALRIGEALALRRGDVVVEADPRPGPWSPLVHVVVSDNLQRIKGEDGRYRMERMGSPKTKTGRRKVPILQVFHEDLFRHMSTITGPKKADLLTTTVTGKPVMDTSYRSTFGAMLKRAGIIRRLHPHAGRRYLVSTLLEQGYEPTAVGEIIGDKDLSVVMEIYAQVRPGRSAEIMREFGHTVKLKRGKTA